LGAIACEVLMRICGLEEMELRGMNVQVATKLSTSNQELISEKKVANIFELPNYHYLCSPLRIKNIIR
jgi:hypothetical protein